MDSQSPTKMDDRKYPLHLIDQSTKDEIISQIAKIWPRLIRKFGQKGQTFLTGKSSSGIDLKENRTLCVEQIFKNYSLTDIESALRQLKREDIISLLRTSIIKFIPEETLEIIIKAFAEEEKWFYLTIDLGIDEDNIYALAADENDPLECSRSCFKYLAEHNFSLVKVIESLKRLKYSDDLKYFTQDSLLSNQIDSDIYQIKIMKDNDDFSGILKVGVTGKYRILLYQIFISKFDPYYRYLGSSLVQVSESDKKPEERSVYLKKDEYVVNWSFRCHQPIRRYVDYSGRKIEERGEKIVAIAIKAEFYEDFEKQGGLGSKYDRIIRFSMNDWRIIKFGKTTTKKQISNIYHAK